MIEGTIITGYSWVEYQLKPAEHLAELHVSLGRLQGVLESGLMKKHWTKKDLISEIESAREHLYRSGFRMNPKDLVNPTRRTFGFNEL